jgi:hypothetical protein
MTPESLELQVLTYLQSVKEAKLLTEGMPEYTVGKEIEQLFTSGVDYLRSNLPNPSIQRMCSVMWDAVEHKVTPVCFGPPVVTLSFIVTGHESARSAMIVTPGNWNEMLRKDPLTQLGALVFVGSQAVDYVNERFTSDPENVVTRACAYEAEYLLTVKHLSPDWELSTYHTKVLANFPEGLASPKAKKVLYDAKPLILA